MKKLSAVLLVALVVLLGVAWCVEHSETSESQFQTYRELKESELISQGWVPAFIPKSAYDIHERHRVDVSDVNVVFRYQPGDTGDIEASCTALNSEGGRTKSYRCRHGDGVVVVMLSGDGKGEIRSEQ